MILRIGGIYCYNEEIKTEAITPYTIGKLWFINFSNIWKLNT